VLFVFEPSPGRGRPWQMSVFLSSCQGEVKRLSLWMQTARYKSLHECVTCTKRFNITSSRGTINRPNALTYCMWQNTCFKWVGSGNHVGMWKITRGYSWDRSIKVRTLHRNNVIQWNSFWPQKKIKIPLCVGNFFFKSLLRQIPNKLDGSLELCSK
jgi:hypothetical protein